MASYKYGNTMKNYVILILPCLFFISSLAQLAPPAPITTVFEKAQPTEPPQQVATPLPADLPALPALEEQAKAIKTINNTLTLKHTGLFSIEGTYSSDALSNLPVSGPIQIQNPRVTGLTAYDIPHKITFQGDFYTDLHFSNNQKSLLEVTLFTENLTNPSDFNAQAQLWIDTTIPEFVYKVKYSGGVTLTIDQNVLENFLRTLLQKVVVKWRELITAFKININEQKQAIASIPSSKADREKIQQIVNKLDTVFTQLIPF